MLAVMAILSIIFSAIICIGFILAIIFGGTFPPPRHFPLPEALRGSDQPIRAGLGVWVGRDKEQD
jgi:hypothetical protein